MGKWRAWARHLVGSKTSLSGTVEVLSSYQEIVADLRTQVDAATKGIEDALRWARIAATFVLIWLGIASLGMLIQGWELSAGTRSREGLNSACSPAGASQRFARSGSERYRTILVTSVAFTTPDFGGTISRTVLIHRRSGSVSIIEVTNLTKYYGKARGIVDVSFSEEAGEIFGFIGPNGAGKSTTIRLLLSLIHPTSGSAKVFGKDVVTDGPEIRRDIGYLPSEVFYYEGMKVIDLLKYSASFYPARLHPAHEAALRHHGAGAEPPHQRPVVRQQEEGWHRAGPAAQPEAVVPRRADFRAWIPSCSGSSST